MCIGILILRHPIVRMFLSDPTVGNLSLLRCVSDNRGSFLFYPGAAGSLPNLDPEYAEWTRSFRGMYDRARHAYCSDRRTFRYHRLYLRMHCQPTCVVRCLRTSDSRILSYDEKAISICKLDNIFYFVIIIIVRSVHSKLGENPFHIITCQPKPYLL